MLKLSKPNISEAAIERVSEVLRSGNLVHGLASEQFEKALSEYLGIEHALLVSSGTAALHLALLAIDLGPGDAVIVPDFTFPATVNAVRLTGATPVIVDVGHESYCISPEAIEQALRDWAGPETIRAIMPVHEFGHPADMDRINEIAKTHGLHVIEDAACALGAKTSGKPAGTVGTVGCFSLHPRKTLTTGEGGLVVTNDPVIAQKIAQMRNHGIRKTPTGITFSGLGFNYRLTNFQAALGLEQLKHLDSWIETRRALSEFYFEELKDLTEAGMLMPPKSHEGHSWQTYMTVLNDSIDRAWLISEIKDLGIECNLGAQSQSAMCPAEVSPKPNGMRLFKQGLALPFCESYSKEDLRTVIQALNKILR